MSAATAVAGANSTQSTHLPNQFAQMGSDEFLKVLLAELTQQDPLAPSDTTAILEQLSSLRNIESQLSLQERLESLVMQNSVASASGMIGKLVEGLDDANNAIEGIVTSVRIQKDKAYLELDTGHTLQVDRVRRIASLDE